MNKIIITVLCLLLAFTHYTLAQLKIDSGGTLNTSGNATIILEDADLINEGIFDATDGGIVVLKENSGTTTQNFGGSGTTQLDNLTIERNSFDVKLTSNISIEGDLNFSSGKLDLNGNDIILLNAGQITNETETARLIGPNGGVIMKTVDLIAPANENIGNLGAEITSAANLGNTTIKRGHRPKTLPAGKDFQRYFDISPTNNSGLNATLRFQYFDLENPSITEANLDLWKLSTPNGWAQQIPDKHNSTKNFFRISNIDDCSIWTFAGDSAVDNDGDGLSLQQGDCDDGNAIETVDLSLNNNPIEESYYIVSNQITSTGTVLSNEVTTFQAGSEVILDVGFVVNQGANFRAFIVECGVPPASLNAITGNDIEAIRDVKETTPEFETASKNGLQYQLFPNPMSEQGFVNLLLEKETKVEIQLFNNVGKMVKTISPKQIKNAGKHNLEFETSSLASGIYFVRFQINNDIFTEKIIIIKNK